MKKRIIPIIATVIAAVSMLTLASCSANNANANNPNGQGYQRPDMMGQVTAIAGNEVTIKVIELPNIPSFSPGQRSPRPSGWQRSPRPSGEPRQTPSPGDSSQNPVASLAPGQSPAPSGSQGGRRGFGMNFTGEEKTIVIPPGVPITTVQRSTTGTNGNNTGGNNAGNNGGNNRGTQGGNMPRASVQTVQMDFKDIKVGDILSIWYSQKDNTAIARVSIQSTSGNGNNGGFFPGGFPGGDFPGGQGGPGGNRGGN